MAADPIIYCLEQLTDYDTFERLCIDLLRSDGYVGIEPIGGTGDKGRDALHHCSISGKNSVFAFSVREDWKVKLRQDAQKTVTRGHDCDEFVFLTTSDLSGDDRDGAVAEILGRFCLKLKLYPLERLRSLIAADDKFVRLHPAIFTPSLFAALLHPKASLSVRASATRRGTKQLAQLRVLNDGAQPVRVVAWHVASPDYLNESMKCLRGSLPHRLLEQEELDLLIEIDDHPIEKITSIGVLDSDGRRWHVSPENIDGLKKTALYHAPPLPSFVRVEPTLEDLKKLNVEIEVRVADTPSIFGPSDAIIFKNHGPSDATVFQVAVEWEYDPPRLMSPAGTKPIVTENTGSVYFGYQGRRLVSAGEATEFTISPDMAEVFTSILSQDIKPNSVVIKVAAGGKLCWQENSPETTTALRKIAQRIVDGWYSAE